MATYFTSRAPSRQSRKSAATSLAECSIGDADEDAGARLAALAPKNEEAKAALLARHAADAYKWLLPLREGFSVLFYGFGSKRRLLEGLAREHFTDGGIVAFSGFVPTLTAREVLTRVATLLRTPRGGDTFALLEHIRQAPARPRLYVIIHNIDGPGLQGADAQEALSSLARCPAVRLLASADHANAPLLWDKRAAGRFNWVWVDATTYAPYAAEAREAPSLLLGRRDAARGASAATVLRTLVPHARACFGILARHQLEAADDGDEPGMTAAQLFRLARERFLVSNEAALRSHLTEFRDHHLLATRRGQDGADLLVIPIEPETLQQILEDLEAP